jgi:hypothetical protein
MMTNYAAHTELTPSKTETCLDLCLELDDPELFSAICLVIGRLLLMRCVRSGTAPVRSTENDREVGSESGSGSRGEKYKKPVPSQL